MANGDLQDQLTQLRRRIARIDRKYANPSPPPLPVTRLEPPDQYCPQEWLKGDEIETEHGRHFETERLWERHRRHGSMNISDLEDLPPDLLHSISNGEVLHAPPSKWAFLDTETTGLAGGAGTYALLIGGARIPTRGLRVRHFLIQEVGAAT